MAKKSESSDKKPCITYDQLQKACPQGLTLQTPSGQQVLLEVRQFSSGSYGLAYNGPLSVQAPDGTPLQLQANMNLTIKYSKPKDAKAA